MKLTPLDIQQQHFRNKLWGYDPKEVDAFLDVVAAEFEDVIRENKGLKDDLQRRDAELQRFREREKDLKETMITATRTTEDIKQNAHKEAEIVLARAEAQAEQVVQNAHSRLVRVIDDLDELKRQKVQFEETLRSLVQSHLKLLETMSDREPGGEMVSMLARRHRARPKPQDEQPQAAGADDLIDPRNRDAQRNA
ncbi:MAG: DivIVA domain-containing protein [Myxococcota bacterium]